MMNGADAMLADAGQLVRADLGAGGRRKKLLMAQEHFIFAHRFTFAAAGRLEFTHAVGNEAHWIWKRWSGRGSAIAAGTTNVLEGFTVRVENSASGRRLESEEVLAITLWGTIGLPQPVSVPHLFPKTSTIRIVINNLVAGANIVDISLIGFKLYMGLPGID